MRTLSDEEEQAVVTGLVEFVNNEPFEGVCDYCSGEEKVIEGEEFEDSELVFTHEPTCRVQRCLNLLRQWGYSPRYQEEGQDRFEVPA